MGLRSQNNPQASFRDVFSATGTDAMKAGGGGGASGHVATGGVISEYTSGSDVYRAHVFTSSGTFDVTTVGTLDGDGVEFLVVGGGAGGGGSRDNYAGQGGGGAGGLITNVPGVSTPAGSPNPSVNLSRALDFPVTDGGTYPVVVGAGGVGGYYPGGGFPQGTGDAGSPSVLTHPSSPYTVTATGGGGGGAGADQSGNAAQQGASGGGGSGYPTTVQNGAAANPNNNPDRQGHPGGTGAPGGPQSSGGGGGGAGGAGENGLGPGHPRAARGGLGLEVNITGTNVAYAGGGGSGSYFNPHNTVRDPNGPENGGGGGSGGLGGGTDLYRTIGQNGAPGTGGGGGGATAHHPPGGPRQGGTGGGGTVIIRYKIAQLDGTAKATGGNVSFYNGKTIHTFLRSGTFTTPASFNETCEVVVVGGGGGGAGGQQPSRYAGGGGGAGGVAIHPGTPVSGANTITVTVGTGGAGSPGNQGGGANHGSNGSPSYWGPGPVPAGITGLGGGWGGGDQGPRGVDGGGGASQSPGPVGSGGGGGELFNGNPDAGYGGNAGQPNQAQLAGTANYGNPGGSGSASPDVNYRRGGGGGGAGGAGAQASSNNDNTTAHGGIGMQLPVTFHNPDSAPGPAGGGLGAPGPTATNVSGGVSGKFWIAGGGGGGSSHPSARAGKGGGNDPGGGGHSGPGNYAGAGIGHRAPNMTNAASRGWANTGGGGGGAGGNPGTPVGDGGDGGSGIVLIAYPS